MISCAMLHAYDLLFCIVCQGLFVCVSAAEQLQIDVLLRQDILVAMCVQNHCSSRTDARQDSEVLGNSHFASLHQSNSKLIRASKSVKTTAIPGGEGKKAGEASR